MKRITAFATIAILSACASAGETVLPEEPHVPLFSSAAMATVPESALGPQTLEAGECALFLWSKTDATKFIFFSKALSGTALLSQATGPAALTQTGASGDIFGQFNTHTSYTSAAGDQISLALTPGPELEGGQRIQSGLLTATVENDWQTKLPILGVRACQPE